MLAIRLAICLCVALSQLWSGLCPREEATRCLDLGSRKGQAASAQAAAETAGEVRSLGRIGGRSDFELLSRTYYRGRFYALPHLMFVIDRGDHDRIYYVNSKLYPFHKDFVNATYLSLERGRAFYEDNYLRGDRRFILGCIAYQTASSKYTFEFWEGDRITNEMLREAFRVLAGSFYSNIYFKPNSLAQEEAAAGHGGEADRPNIPILTASELSRDTKYQALNIGAGIGQLRILEEMTPDTVIDRNQIVIFKQVPIHLPPLSGIVTTEPASPLSHINMLAKSWAIPNAYIQNADLQFKRLEGKYVRLEVKEDGFTLAPADVTEVEKRQREWVRRADQVTPAADLSYTALTDLKSQRAADARRFGAKSANLGELIHAGLPEISVPPGFAIPFHYYREFIRHNNLEERIATAVEEDKFVHDPKYRKASLGEIRGWIQAGSLDQAFARAVLGKAHREFAGKGLFARSSTNAEDLPNFNGAGLYTTVPNCRTDSQLLEGIKTVWASVWNYEAYEARESFGMNHFGVYPAVLIQEGIDADSAGVAITTDPFDRRGFGIGPEANGSPFSPVEVHSGNASDAPGRPVSNAAVYINAKRGLGMKVVEGRRVAEQVIYHPAWDTIQVLTRSQEDTRLQFDQNGGIKEVKTSGQPSAQPVVLTDPMVRRLARAALQIKSVFAGRDQDIEWVYAKGRLYIVQSRPYIE
jgi:hypothetical protein